MLSSLILVSAPAAKTFAAAQVRFVHAVPGADAVTVSVGDEKIASGVGFAGTSGYESVAAGRAGLRVDGEDGRPVAAARQELEDGARYTAVALGPARRPELRIYADGKATGRTARLRVIHAAPELGEPAVKFGSKVVTRRVRFRDASPYTSLTPATADLTAGRSGSNEPLVRDSGVTLTAGTASTAILAGTAGERAQVVVLSDGSSAPGRAPQTGLGGLSDDDSGRLLIALLAALGAGALGGAAYRLSRGRGRA